MYYRLNNRRKASEKKNVVIIEDNKFMLSLLTNILSEDFSVQTFTCANEAKFWMCNGNDVDVIISDINLDKSNGIDFAKQLKADDHLKNIPFIFLSGMDERELSYESQDLSYDAFINKPFNPGVLIDQIKEVA